MSVCSFGVFGDDGISANESIALTEYNGAHKKEIDFLKQLGIIDGSNIFPYKPVTRAEFTGAAMRLTGMEEFAAVNTGFSDVTAENPMSGAIKTAADMRIVTGVGNGLFKPDDIITARAGIKIIVSLLGYDVKAQSLGGYPEGYLYVASETGLLKGIDIDGTSDNCTWETAICLIYNALFTDILEKELTSHENYAVNNGETPMTKYMGISVYKGIVTADGFTSIRDGVYARKGYVCIDKMQLVNSGDISKYLGCYVTAYYRINENGENQLIAYKLKNNMREETVRAEDISPQTSKAGGIRYYTDGGSKLSACLLSEQTKFIYNGKSVLYSELNDNMLMPKCGKIRIVNYGGNSPADVVFIENTEVFIVDSISLSTGIIRDIYNPDKMLNADAERKDISVRIIYDGDEAQLSDIRRNYVISVTRSLDGELVSMVVCSDKLKGAVQEIGEDFITIDGYTYSFVKENEAEIKKLQPGDRATFYFTADDEVAGYGLLSAENEQYGYLIAAYCKKSGIDSGNTASFRIFNLDGKFATYVSHDKITLNWKNVDSSGKTYKGSTIIEDLKAKNIVNPGQIFQLVKYSLNADNEVTNILVAEDNRTEQNLGTCGGTGYYNDNFSLDYRTKDYESVKNRESFYKASGILAGRYVLGATAGIKMPSRSNLILYGQEQIDLSRIERMFGIFSPRASWVNDQDSAGLFVEVYDTDKNFNCKVLLSYDDAMNDKADGQPTVGIPVTEYEYFMVDKYATVLDEDGTVTGKLYGYYKKEYAGYAFDTEAEAFRVDPSLMKLRRGDVIRIALSNEKKITNVLKVFTLHPELDEGYDNSITAQQLGGTFPLDSQGKPNINGWINTNPNKYFLNGNYYNEFRGENAGINKLYPQVVGDNSKNWNVISRLLHAKAYKVSDGNIIMDMGTTCEGGKFESGIHVPYLILSCNSVKPFICVYDEKSDTVKPGSLDDIDPGNDGQSLVVRIRYLVPYEILVVNRKSIPEQEIPWAGGYIY